MLIKELSRRTGVSVRSIRYYETKKIISSVRLANGYRDYDEAAIERVRSIQLYLGLGLNTEEIAHIIDCPTSLQKDRPLCKAAYALYKNKLAEVNQQLDLLRAVQSRLEARMREFESLDY